MDYLFRFEKPRQYQKEMVEDIYDALERRTDILVNAPTGIGKTDASISAALTFALKNDLDVFFLTPKISQHKIAVEALSGIKAKSGMGFNFVDIVGKQNMCINDSVNMIESDAFYGACESLVKSGKCGFFSAAKNFEPSALDYGHMEKGHNSFFDFAFKHGVCAYEIAAKLARNSRVVIAGYAHLLNPYNKGTFLKKIGHTLDNSIVIWDEAHNLMNAASSYFSSAITSVGIERAMKELGQIGSSIDLDYLKFELGRLAEKKLSGSTMESFVSLDEFPEEITANAEKLIDQLDKAALEYIQSKNAKRSAIVHVSRFLKSFMDADASTARIISKKSGRPALLVSCLYPERAITVFQEAYANVFMSATLQPMAMYADLFGLKNSVAKSYRSPFPKGNVNAYIDDEFTTKFSYRSAEQYKRIAQRIQSIKQVTPGNLAVFFPSFSVLDGVARHISFSRKYTQRSSMKSIATENLIKSFIDDGNGLLLAVMGGSLSEGVDYPNNAIKGIAIVGIPLAVPDLELRAQIAYLDKKFSGKGQDYAYIIPALIRTIQASGRAIRSESDRATIVLMDRRYSWRIYRSVVSNSISIKETGDYINDMRLFWSGRHIDAFSLGNELALKH
ncbi:ATP-dependent DNA helicase [Candidatus Marsarchaeota archaeon]|nr:ATP-dependent DNA helicase [Candidatus Marsarchaeota archaeon]MCL5405006.1 ATP-dependent DNA helicase [Candidatus Marsarchaeota archaeon]